MRIVLAVIAILIVSFLAAQSEAGLLEDLRSGKSKIKAVSKGNVIHTVENFRLHKKNQSNRDFKAIAVVKRGFGAWGVWNQRTATGAVLSAVSECENKWERTCEIYSVGSEIVADFSPQELANAIEAYHTGHKITKSENRLAYIYCRDSNGSAHVVHGTLSCEQGANISLQEYRRLKSAERKLRMSGQKTTVVSEVEKLDNLLGASMNYLKYYGAVIELDNHIGWILELLDAPFGFSEPLVRLRLNYNSNSKDQLLSYNCRNISDNLFFIKFV